MDNITVYCTRCGNPIACEAGREFVFCTRCGHKIILIQPQPVEQEVTSQKPRLQSLSPNPFPIIPLLTSRFPQRNSPKQPRTPSADPSRLLNTSPNRPRHQRILNISPHRLCSLCSLFPRLFLFRLHL